MCSKLLVIFKNLLQIEEKMPVTVRFPSYAFNEDIHNMYQFHKWDVFLTQIFYDSHKN